MRNRSFISEEHVNQYLSGTIILYKEKPIYIGNAYYSKKDIVLSYSLSYQRHLEDSYSEGLRADDTDIDMTPFPMGYVNRVNINGKADTVRVFRSPMRLMKIGLCIGNTYIAEETGRNIIYTREFYDTVVGKFPTFETALEKINKKDYHSVAFSRYFALNNKECINYVHLDTPIGKIKKDSLVLNDEHTYLSELLEKEMSR